MIKEQMSSPRSSITREDRETVRRKTGASRAAAQASQAAESAAALQDPLHPPAIPMTWQQCPDEKVPCCRSRQSHGL